MKIGCVLPGDLVKFTPVAYRSWGYGVVLRHTLRVDRRGFSIQGYYDVLTWDGIKLMYEGFMERV